MSSKEWFEDRRHRYMWGAALRSSQSQRLDQQTLSLVLATRSRTA
jgi:hypothetical protein